MFRSIITVMWSNPRIGPWNDPLPSVHGRPTWTHRRYGSSSTPVRGRHTDYGFCAPDEVSALQQRISTCVAQTSKWMKVNRLQLNAAKSEQLWCTSPRQHDRLPNIPLHVGCDTVQPVRCVRNLGIFNDSDVSMKTHITKTVPSCFAALHRVCSIRRSVSQAVLLSLVTSLIMTRLHYGSAVLAGLPSHLLNRLLSMLNAAAHLVCHARKYDHVTHLLWDLPERIQFRLAVLAFCCHNHKAPSYLAEDLHWTDEAESRHRLRSSSCQRLIVP